MWLQCQKDLLLAGGTNSYTIDCLKKADLFQSISVAGIAAFEMASSHQALIGGIAYGGYARKIVGRALRKIPEQFGPVRIEEHPDHLLEALQEAMSLVGPVKGYISSPSKPFIKQVDRQ